MPLLSYLLCALSKAITLDLQQSNIVCQTTDFTALPRHKTFLIKHFLLTLSKTCPEHSKFCSVNSASQAMFCDVAKRPDIPC